LQKLHFSRSIVIFLSFLSFFKQLTIFSIFFENGTKMTKNVKQNPPNDNKKKNFFLEALSFFCHFLSFLKQFSIFFHVFEKMAPE